MKKCTWSCALAVLILGVSTTKASEFDGLYIGVNGGSNKSSATSLSDKSTNYAGVVAGYNWDMQGYLLGVDGFYDGHGSSYTERDDGLDVKLGLPMQSWLPYAKLGMAATSPGNRFHGGLGVEYKLADSWSVNGEWTTDSKEDNAITYKNNNFVIGLNYYFEGGKKAAASAAAAREAAARDAAARDAAAREAAAREAAARDAAAREAAAKEAADKAAAAKEAAAKEAAAKEAWKTSIIEKPVRLEGANFATGSSKLLPGASGKLDEVVNAAKQFPDIELGVMGYTDSTGNAKKNLKLSQDRADAVKAYLVKKGVAADRINTKGFGEDNPIADNATAEGRARNRRVEIHYTVKEEQKVRVTQ